MSAERLRPHVAIFKWILPTDCDHPIERPINAMHQRSHVFPSCWFAGANAISWSSNANHPCTQQYLDNVHRAKPGLCSQLDQQYNRRCGYCICHVGFTCVCCYGELAEKHADAPSNAPKKGVCVRSSCFFIIHTETYWLTIKFTINLVCLKNIDYMYSAVDN